MQVVQVNDVATADVLDINLELLDVNVPGGALHHDLDNVLDNGDRGEEDNDGEEDSAEGVRHPHAWEEVNDGRRDNDAHTHQHVAEDVEEGCVNVDVARRCVVVVIVTVRVAVVVLSLVTLLVVKQVLLDLLILDLGLGVVVSVRVSMVVIMVTMVMIVVVLSAQMVVSVTRVQDLHLNQVENEAHDGDDKHDVALHLRWLEEALTGLDKEPDGHNPDGGDGDESADNFGSVPPVCQTATRGLLRQVQSQDRDSEAEHVGGQMGGVCKDGDRACHVAADELRRDEEH